jgi:hypothetical protein
MLLLGFCCISCFLRSFTGCLSVLCIIFYAFSPSLAFTSCLFSFSLVPLFVAHVLLFLGFLIPLQQLADKESRIHCSLNLNTETGRLSSRRPNLQNQPALEKDSYKIRDAFIAEEGKTFIVADYGQLELRILAHITNCQSMIQAFKDGGCFHSRTALGMYPYIKEAVEKGLCDCCSFLSVSWFNPVFSLVLCSFVLTLSLSFFLGLFTLLLLLFLSPSSLLHYR